MTQISRKKMRALLGIIFLIFCGILCSCDRGKPTPNEDRDTVIMLSESEITIRMGKDVQISLLEGKIHSHQVEPLDILSVTYAPDSKVIDIHPMKVGQCKVLFFNKEGIPTELRISVVKRTLQPTALEYIAPYNIAHDGVSFDKSGFPENSALFTWSEAKDRFSEITIEGQRWHLPTFKEWTAVASEFPNVVYYGKKDTLRTCYEQVVINGVTVEGASEFFNTTVGITYAVRFKDTDYYSAWRYSYERYKDKVHKFDSRLVITARPIDLDLAISAERDLTRTDFWEQSSSLDRTVELPATGCIKMADSPNDVFKRGASGFYWASDLYEIAGGSYPNIFYFNSMYILPSYYKLPNDKFAVRLFKN